MGKASIPHHNRTAAVPNSIFAYHTVLRADLDGDLYLIACDIAMQFTYICSQNNSGTDLVQKLRIKYLLMHLISFAIAHLILLGTDWENRQHAGTQI